MTRVAAAGLVTVTLVRAWDPAGPERNGRIEFVIALDPQGHPDVQAWLDDPAVWPARQFDSQGGGQPGDVAHDEDGWQLRFFLGDGPDPDMPVHRLCHLEAGLRPGAVLTLRGPEGHEASWRVVGITPAGA